LGELKFVMVEYFGNFFHPIQRLIILLFPTYHQISTQKNNNLVCL
jgi:hypothetical protein